MLSLGASTLLIGYAYAFNSLTSLVSRIPFSNLADKYGISKFILLGLALNSLSIILLILIPEPSFILLARAIQGIGLSFFLPPILSYTVNIRIKGFKDSEVVAYVSTGVALAQFMGPMIASFIFLIKGFTSLFLAALAFSLAGIGVLFLLPIKENSKPNPLTLYKKDSFLASIRRIMHKGFMLNMLSRFFASYTFGTIMAFLPLLVTLDFEMPKQEVGFLFAVGAIPNIFARALSAKISLGGEGSVLILGTSFITLSSLLFALSPNLSLIWIGMVLNGLGFGFFVPSSISLTGKLIPNEHKTLGMGLHTMMIDLGMGIGSLIPPFLLTQIGFKGIFFFSALLSFFGLMIQFLANRYHKTENKGL